MLHDKNFNPSILKTPMTRNDLWEQNYSDIMDFMTGQKRRPSKHRLEEHQMLNWLKYQKKRLAQGKMAPDRIDKFQKLLTVAEQFLRKNQYAYTHQHTNSDGFYGNLFDHPANSHEEH